LTQSNPDSAPTRSLWTGGFATLVAAYLVFFVAIGGVVAWLALAGPLEPETQTAMQSPAKPDLTADHQSNEEPPPAADTAETQPAPAKEPEPETGDSVASFDPELVADSPNGKLPIVGPNGKTPWQTYAAAFDAADDGPRLAIVIEDLGLNKDRTEDAIKHLPPEVTLAFSPYAENLQGWANKARAAGHEILLGLPMEPVSYPQDDPGPDALLTGLSADQNVQRLQHLMGKVTGYVGVINAMGSKFTASTSAMTPVLEDISRRGLVFVDSSATRLSVAAKIARGFDVPRAINNRYVDNDLTADAIDDQLTELEKVAQGYGAAVGIARSYPVSIERLAAWIPTLKSKGIMIAPITAVVNRQPIR
jgi:uncharacterized protein